MQQIINRMRKGLRRPAARLAVALTGAVLIGCGATAVRAQSLFSPAIIVNEDVVTYYELRQRALFLRVLRAPGNADAQAREELILDRLRSQAVDAAGISLTPEEVEAGIEEFAARANLSGPEFLAAVGRAGVAPETVRDFTRTAVSWRELVRSRFLSRARPTNAEVDRALGRAGGGGGVRVLLSEIIMPATPQTLQEVEARAARIAQFTSTGAFADAARRYSATQTRSRGGRMDWMPINNLPPALRPLILALSPGEVTDPITLPNAVALFQLRDIEETEIAAPVYSAIEYAAYYIPGGRSAAALERANKVAARVDTCDDLYGVALGQPPEVLARESLPPAEIPQDIALELAKLDEGEISTALTGPDGQSLVLLMLCGRTAALNEDASREDVAAALTQQRLAALAQSYLDQLRADALIIEK